MSNVIHLNVPSLRPSRDTRLAAMIRSFAEARRFGDDVFWLKENAELLNILECTGSRVPLSALAPHEGFYAQVEKRIEFFPQYYRFLLSICLDLEALGMPGDKAAALVEWAHQQGLAEAELSDLQRAEARRLMQRRGVDPMAHDGGLEARLRRFIARSETFAMPNKKAAYELTHIVFYLSEYGRVDPQLEEAAVTSLEFAGLLAYLDQNADLLAEICVALRFAGRTPSPIWEGWLERETHRFSMTTGPEVAVQDDYHDYFVCNWLMSVSGKDAFLKDTEADRCRFTRATPYAGPLRDISECMFRLDEARSSDWTAMRGQVEDAVSEIGFDILTEAQQSSDKFDAFFEGFARTTLREAHA
ncbi:hypothetical protein [Thalassococcus sp. S3]|uniref:DUF6902 family protein n=1 Tax=Thalassococcus sp. S3 TaxID=2017482 RepID=UPI0010247F35|nr:hypothetical protein [Thalassococcus sp. S3]QBF31568.1 hypothetical protein CFI11_10110 [Thalassococcus sp. S3]